MGTETRTGPTPGVWWLAASSTADGRYLMWAVGAGDRELALFGSREDAMLSKAASNAVQTAAARLGVDPVELAEALADGGVAELVECLAAGLAEWSIHEKADEHAAELCERIRPALARIPARKGGGA